MITPYRSCQSCATQQSAEGTWDDTHPLEIAQWYEMSARAHLGLGNLEEAEQACVAGIAEIVRRNETEALGPGESADSSAEGLYLQLAEIAARQGDYAPAAEGCRRVIARKDFVDVDEFRSQPTAIYRLGWWFSAESRIASAARVFDQAPATPSGPDLALGYLYLGANRYIEAAKSLQLVHENGSSAEINWLLA